LYERTKSPYKRTQSQKFTRELTFEKILRDCRANHTREQVAKARGPDFSKVSSTAFLVSKLWSELACEKLDEMTCEKLHQMAAQITIESKLRKLEDRYEQAVAKNMRIEAECVALEKSMPALPEAFV